MVDHTDYLTVTVRWNIFYMLQMRIRHKKAPHSITHHKYLHKGRSKKIKSND